MDIVINYLCKVPGIVVALLIHQFVLALISSKKGDLLPAEKGRLTLNPINHIEPLGFIIMLVFSFGWGKPVQTSAMYYKNRKKDTFATYATPIAVNFILSVLFCFVYSFYSINIFDNPTSYINTSFPQLSVVLDSVLYYLFYMNIAVALVNLIPVYPFDGAKILNLFLPSATIMKITQKEKIIQLLYLGATFYGFTAMLFNPIIYGIQDLVNFIMSR